MFILVLCWYTACCSIQVLLNVRIYMLICCLVIRYESRQLVKLS